jgi:hypothetical protein
MKKIDKHTWLMGAILAASGMASCGQTEPRDLGDGREDLADGETRLLVGDYANLTAAEARDYHEDREYLRSLVSPDTAVHLNLADPRQHRLAMARLKIAGKSRYNAPNLFATIEQTRQEHVRRGYGKGLITEVGFRNAGGDGVADDLEDGRKAMHFISTATVSEEGGEGEEGEEGEEGGESSEGGEGGQGYQVGQIGEGAASSTSPEGSDYTMLDVGYYDADGVPLAEPNIVEQFGGGTDVFVQTDADLTLSDVGSYVVDSLLMEESSAAGLTMSYVYTVMGLESTPPAGFQRTKITRRVDVTAPVDVNGDGYISVCLSRTWTGECDYNLDGMWTVKMPLKGSIQLTSTPHVFNQSLIAAIQADPANHPQSGHIKLVLADPAVGGGCDVGPDGALQSSMDVFWSNVTLSPDQKILSWDMTGPNSAFFDDGCRQVQNTVYLTMRLQLPVQDTTFGTNEWLSQTLSNQPGSQSNDFTYDDIEMTNGCLAAGTMLQMADGGLVAVEDVSMGAHVFNSTHHGAHGLTVTDTAVGFEEVPMVRLVADRGHSVLMTEMHPVQTPDRGIVLAKDLEEGDLVVTVSGVSALYRVGREEYGGKVYNVKLGTEHEQAALGGEDLTLVYANGFLVGDGQVQSKYEAIAAAEGMQGDVLARLPSQWHLDYYLSPLRNR